MLTRCHLGLVVLATLGLWGCEQLDRGDLPYALSAPGASLGVTVPVNRSVLETATGVSQRAQVASIDDEAVEVTVQVYDSDDAGFVEETFDVEVGAGETQQVVLSGLTPGTDVPVTVEATSSSGQVLTSFSFTIDLPPGRFVSNDPSDSGMPFAPGGSGDLFRIDFNPNEMGLFNSVFTRCTSDNISMVTPSPQRVPTISGGLLDLGGEGAGVSNDHIGEALGSAGSKTFFPYSSNGPRLCFEARLKVDSNGKAAFGLIENNSCPTVPDATNIVNGTGILEIVEVDGTAGSNPRITASQSGGTANYNPGQFVNVKMCIEPIGGGSHEIETFVNGTSIGSTFVSTPSFIHTTFRGRPASGTSAVKVVDFFRVFPG